jgi:hypothetical protein
MAMTRTFSLLMHEEVYPALIELAEKETGGNINKMLRALIYSYLVDKGAIEPSEMIELLER